MRKTVSILISALLILLLCTALLTSCQLISPFETTSPNDNNDNNDNNDSNDSPSNPENANRTTYHAIIDVFKGFQIIQNKFNNKGKIQERLSFNMDPEKGAPKYLPTVLYNYDATGRLVSYVNYNYCENEFKVVSDAKGTPIYAKGSDNNGAYLVEFTCDQKGNIVKEAMFLYDDASYNPREQWLAYCESYDNEGWLQDLLIPFHRAVIAGSRRFTFTRFSYTYHDDTVTVNGHISYTGIGFLDNSLIPNWNQFISKVKSQPSTTITLNLQVNEKLLPAQLSITSEDDDEENKEIISAKYSYDNDLCLSIDTEFTYIKMDESGLVEQETETGKILYSYSSNGDLKSAENLSYNEYKELEGKELYEYSYNDNGTISTVEFMEYDGDNLEKYTEKTVTRYTYNSDGSLKSEEESSEDEYGLDKEVIYYTYNRDGSLKAKEIQDFSSDGSLSEKTVYQYTYHSNGSLATQTRTYYGEKDTVTYEERLTYNTDGTLSIDERYSKKDDNVTKDYRRVFTYTEDGVYKSGIGLYYDNDGNPKRESRYTFTYNAHEIIATITSTQYDKYGNSFPEHSYTYTMDLNGTLKTAVSLYYDEGEFQRKDVYQYTYDFDGLLSNEICLSYDRNDQLISEDRNAYTYDYNGNKITASCLSYDANGTLDYKGYYTYYADGERKTSESIYFKPDGSPEIEYRKYYDESGSETRCESITYSDDGSRTEVTEVRDEDHQWTTTYRYYDANDRFIEEKVEDGRAHP